MDTHYQQENCRIYYIQSNPYFSTENVTNCFYFGFIRYMYNWNEQSLNNVISSN